MYSGETPDESFVKHLSVPNVQRESLDLREKFIKKLDNFGPLLGKESTLSPLKRFNQLF